ncbi:MAG: hypothetical protein HRU26_07385 [Psychroserpens sp.]|nr:hypothetical protein [Psychroserpens sp.]
MKLFSTSYFGILWALLICLSLLLLSYAFSYNFMYWNSVAQIPVPIGIFLAVSVFLMLVLYKRHDRSFYNFVFALVALFIFVFMFSKLEWLVICCAEDYDSTSEWKTAKSLSWMYTLPFSGFILLLFGGVFDIFRELILKRRSTI